MMAARQEHVSPDDRLICVGVVTGARGLGGQVRIMSFTSDPADIAAYGTVFDETRRRSFRIKVDGHSRGQVLAHMEGVRDRNAAEALKGVKLYVPRHALPEPEGEEFYHADLVGLVAELVGGGVLGTVMAIHDFGAGVMLEVEGPEIAGENREVGMVPFTRAAVPEVDMVAGRIIVDPPAGLLDAPGNESPGNESKSDENEERS